MAKFLYPFEEFCDHLAALKFVQNYDHVIMSNGESVEIRAEPCFWNMVPRVMDYMRQLYSTEPEAFFKGSRLAMILNHAATQIQILEDANLAVIGGVGKPSLVHPKAWRALHYFYALRGNHVQGKIAIEEIIDYANALPDEPAA